MSQGRWPSFQNPCSLVFLQIFLFLFLSEREEKIAKVGLRELNYIIEIIRMYHNHDIGEKSPTLKTR